MGQVVAARESEPGQPAAVPCAQGFRLLVESLGTSARAAAPTATDLPALALPAGVSYLSPAREPLALVVRKPQAPAFVLEPVQVDGQAGGRARLLLLMPVGLRARLNGQAVPVVALLRVGDQLQLDTRAILHVTEYRAAGAVSPPAALVGSPCGVCRLPLTAETSITICTCKLPMHLEGPPKPESERLECALFGCPSCGSAVPTESGPVWLPEL